MEFKKIVFSEEKNVYMRCYLQECGGEFPHLKARPAMVVLPGGAYAMCSEIEADPVALAYAKAGFQTFILNYTLVSVGKWPSPLEDYDKAVDYIKEHAEEFGVDVDRISCVGFSAGGHLAAMAASCAKNKPAVAVLCYPGLKTMSYVPNATEAINEKTSPCFIYGTRDDMISPKEMLEYMTRLTDFDIRYECHIYSFGPHGASTGEHFVKPVGTHITERYGNWVDDSIGFIKELIGDFGEKGMTEPLTTKYLNGNHESYYSLDCTLKYLMEREETKFAVEPLIEIIKKMFPENEEDSSGSIDAFGLLGTMTVRELYKTVNYPEIAVAEIEAKLKEIVKE